MTDLPNPPRITLRDVTLKRGARMVLKGLTMTLDAPRIGLIGRNGSGKSTLIRALAGLVAPEAGEIRVCGADVARDREAALRHVGLLFQNPDHQIIFPTVIEEVAFGLRQQGHSDAEDRARDALDRFARLHWADRPVTELSQGQRHLVCLIAVLAMTPDMLLLDEPMAGLDLPTMAGLQGLLARLPQMVIHATHDLELLADYDRVIWVDRGGIAGDGPPQEVLPAYRHAMSEGIDAFADLAG